MIALCQRFSATERACGLLAYALRDSPTFQEPYVTLPVIGCLFVTRFDKSKFKQTGQWTERRPKVSFFLKIYL